MKVVNKQDGFVGTGQPLLHWRATSRPDASLGDMTEVNHKLTGSLRGEKIIILGPIAWSGMKEARGDGPTSPFCAHELSESFLSGGGKNGKGSLCHFTMADS